MYWMSTCHVFAWKIALQRSMPHRSLVPALGLNPQSDLLPPAQLGRLTLHQGQSVIDGRPLSVPIRFVPQESHSQAGSTNRKAKKTKH